MPGGSPDPFHTLTPTPQDLISIDLAHSRVFYIGTVEIGAGFEELDDAASGDTLQTRVLASRTGSRRNAELGCRSTSERNVP